MLYILIGKNPVHVEDTYKWAAWHGYMLKRGGLFIERDLYPAKKPIKKNKRTTRGQRKASHQVLKKLNAWRCEPVLLSTVFLAVDHGLMGEPILFETMIFGGRYNEYQRRYTNFDDAKKHHRVLRGMIKCY